MILTEYYIPYVSEKTVVCLISNKNELIYFLERLTKWKEARGILLKSKQLVLWDAADLTHLDIINSIKNHCFYLLKDILATVRLSLTSVEFDDIYQNNRIYIQNNIPLLKDMYGNYTA